MTQSVPSVSALRGAETIPPPVGQAWVKRRHHGVVASFVLIVLLPLCVSAWYLWARAADQYASMVGFAVRTEEMSSAVELLGGITDLSGSSSSDTDILYEYIQSQKLVADIDAQLDLRRLWSRPENDPVFAYDAPGSIEDLVDYWPGMVKIAYDSGTGLIQLRVHAFRPGDAHAIATAIYNASSEMINELSAIAREDAIRYARADLEESVERLKGARQAITTFRNANQIVDPTADLQNRTGLMGTLEAQLAEALIEIDLLRDTAGAGDPRLVQARRRVEVIRVRLDEERRKLGLGGGGGAGAEALATVVGNYERLAVDLEFAEQSYVSALAAYDAARAEARRQSRYLAAYVRPTLAETAQYPRRWTLLGLAGLFLFLGWAIAVLVVYALRDRR